MGRILDEILEQEKPEIVATDKVKAADMLLSIHLAELKEQVELAQDEIPDNRHLNLDAKES